MKIDLEEIKSLKKRIEELEKEREELLTRRSPQIAQSSKSDDEASGSAESKQTQNADPNHDFDAKGYAEYLLNELDKEIEECETIIGKIKTEPDFTSYQDRFGNWVGVMNYTGVGGYKRISTSYEYIKGLKFQMKRAQDKLYIIDEQLRCINQHLSSAPSGNIVLTHIDFDERKYDNLMSSRAQYQNYIAGLKRDISDMSSELPSPRRCNQIIDNGDRKIAEMQSKIESLLREQENIKNELSNGTLLHRFREKMDKLCLQIENYEDNSYQCYTYTSGALGSSGYGPMRDEIVSKLPLLRDERQNMLRCTRGALFDKYLSKLEDRLRFFEECSQLSINEIYVKFVARFTGTIDEYLYRPHPLGHGHRWPLADHDMVSHGIAFTHRNALNQNMKSLCGEIASHKQKR
jgi:hypothetical protein